MAGEPRATLTAEADAYEIVVVDVVVVVVDIVVVVVVVDVVVVVVVVDVVVVVEDAMHFPLAQ